MAYLTVLCNSIYFKDVAETPPRRSGRNVGVKATYSDNSKRESKRRRTASKQESSTIDTSNIVEKPKKRRGRRPKTIAVPEEKEPEESAPINIRKDGQSGAIPQIPKASDDVSFTNHNLVYLRFKPLQKCVVNKYL